MTFWQFITTHWGYISAAVLLVLKWSYNAGAFQAGVTVKQFLRAFIGEVIQESPTLQREPAKAMETKNA